MSELMRPMSFAQLMDWALREYRQQGRIFGIRKEKFYRNRSGKYMTIFGEKIASPVGPAAGPNSQLAQNIVAAYLAGSRFIELKTVQKMDGEELRACVPRPCINAQDEGYNVEWSTELRVQEAFEEYVKAWIAIHVLAKETGVASGCDFVFNMSVGYDLDGIKADKVNGYIDGMRDASASSVWKTSIDWVRKHLSELGGFTETDLAAISSQVSNSVTLSTLHGCPPQEIERIARYLLEQKGVHTFIKCNPTLLGYESARKLLDEMGYGYIAFDEHHFQNDLQYGDAVTMIKGLRELANERSLSFGVKITNTFPVQIKRGELPGEEMYMSGRSLFPLSINVAARLSRDFDGQLPISYSGGADAFNIGEIFAVGIQPITVATTILKPGGYERLRQLSDQLEPAMRPDWPGIDAAALTKLTDKLPTLPHYRKESRPAASRKTENPLGLFDCYQAPCKDGGCPIQQQIPEYLKLVADGRYDEAFRVIAIDNATPSITGEICNHACQSKCTRIDYESPLEIRNAKRLAAEAAQTAYIESMKPAALRSDKQAVVVGAGPAGIAAALFLRRNGVAVTVLEKRDRPMGIVEYVIPAFRISEAAIKRDYEMAKKAGVTFRFGVTEPLDVAKLKSQYDFVLLATGAWREGSCPVKEGKDLLRDALDFLLESKEKDCNVPLGKHVAVIGGGDVAMDCARAAKRAPGTESVTIVYRRTREFMPAEAEEIDLALADDVKLVELHGPVSYDGKTLRCEKMVLGDWDESGRRGISGTGQLVELPFDAVISAVGARVDAGAFEAAGLRLDAKNRPQLSESGESSQRGVYVIGDCKAGPSTIVSAVADAKHAAIHILETLGLSHDFVRSPLPRDLEELYDKKGILIPASKDRQDGDRCLCCDQLCELCCDVCPNRANVRVAVSGCGDAQQILHVDGLCNECGNCGIFCPHAGDPYKDKLTVFWTAEDLEDSKNRGFLPLGNGAYTLRLEDGSVLTCGLDDPRVPEQWRRFIQTVEREYAYYLA